MKSHLLKYTLLVVFSVLIQQAYSQISATEFLELNNPAILFDTVAKSTLSVKKEKGKLGLVNALGSWVVPPIYDELGNINEETRQFNTRLNWNNGIIEVKKLGKHGAINCLGQEVIPCKFTNFSRSEDGYFYLEDNTGKRFIADKRGKMLAGTNQVSTFGFRSVSLYQKYPSEQTLKYSYAFIDKKKDTIFKLKNSPYIFSILGNSEGRTAFVMYPIIFGGLGRTHGTIGFLDSEGKIAIPPTYSANYLSGGRGITAWTVYEPAYHHGLALVYKGDTPVYIDKKGKEVIDFKDRPGKVSVFNDFSEEGFTLIAYTAQENGKNTQRMEIIDTTGKAVLQTKNGYFAINNITQTDYFYLIEEDGKTLYNAKLEKQFYVPNSDDNYNYSMDGFPGQILSIIIRTNKKIGTSEYTFIDRKGQQICEYQSTDVYFEPFTGTTISEAASGLIMRNKSNEVVYSCDSCYFNDLYSIKRNNHYTSNVTGVFKFEHGKEVLMVNYKGIVIDQFPSKDAVISNFQNISEQYKIYKDASVDPDVKIAVTQSELDKIYQNMPWKNMR